MKNTKSKEEKMTQKQSQDQSQWDKLLSSESGHEAFELLMQEAMQEEDDDMENL